MSATRMKSADRRAVIVNAAIRLFAEKGFRGVTTRELAAAVGVTEPVLYQHFQTKKDIYTAILETKVAEAAEHSREVLALAELSDDAAFFTAVGEGFIAYFENNPEIIRLLLFSRLERHELADLFYDRLGVTIFEVLGKYVRRRIAAGAFRKLNPEIMARAILGVFEYQGLLAVLNPGRLGTHPRKKLVREIVTVFLDGLRVPQIE